MTTTFSQEKNRYVNEDPSHSNCPIVIVSRKLGNSAFERQKRVSGNDDWLKNLRFGVKNVSNKTIVYFNIDLVIPKQRQLPAFLPVGIFFGNRYAPVVANPSDLILAPDEIGEVGVSTSEISYWNMELEKYGVEDFNLVTLDIREIHFADGTGWKLGIPLQQDPDNPKIWRSLLLQKSTAPSLNWFAFLASAPLSLVFRRSVRIPFSTMLNCSVSAEIILPTPSPPDCGYFRNDSDWNNSCSGCRR
ncbi:MAG: hypothetical protein ABI539_13035 [Acidobacteriota bacterium]